MHNYRRSEARKPENLSAGLLQAPDLAPAAFSNTPGGVLSSPSRSPQDRNEYAAPTAAGVYYTSTPQNVLSPLSQRTDSPQRVSPQRYTPPRKEPMHPDEIAFVLSNSSFASFASESAAVANNNRSGGRSRASSFGSQGFSFVAAASSDDDDDRDPFSRTPEAVSETQTRRERSQSLPQQQPAGLRVREMQHDPELTPPQSGFQAQPKRSSPSTMLVPTGGLQQQQHYSSPPAAPPRADSVRVSIPASVSIVPTPTNSRRFLRWCMDEDVVINLLGYLNPLHMLKASLVNKTWRSALTSGIDSETGRSLLPLPVHQGYELSGGFHRAYPNKFAKAVHKAVNTWNMTAEEALAEVEREESSEDEITLANSAQNRQRRRRATSVASMNSVRSGSGVFSAPTTAPTSPTTTPAPASFSPSQAAIVPVPSATAATRNPATKPRRPSLLCPSVDGNWDSEDSRRFSRNFWIFLTVVMMGYLCLLLYAATYCPSADICEGLATVSHAATVLVCLTVGLLTVVTVLPLISVKFGLYLCSIGLIWTALTIVLLCASFTFVEHVMKEGEGHLNPEPLSNQTEILSAESFCLNQTGLSSSSSSAASGDDGKMTTVHCMKFDQGVHVGGWELVPDAPVGAGQRQFTYRFNTTTTDEVPRSCVVVMLLPSGSAEHVDGPKEGEVVRLLPGTAHPTWQAGSTCPSTTSTPTPRSNKTTTKEADEPAIAAVLPPKIQMGLLILLAGVLYVAASQLHIRLFCCPWWCTATEDPLLRPPYISRGLQYALRAEARIHMQGQVFHDRLSKLSQQEYQDLKLLTHLVYYKLFVIMPLKKPWERKEDDLQRRQQALDIDTANELLQIWNPVTVSVVL